MVFRARRYSSPLLSLSQPPFIAFTTPSGVQPFLTRVPVSFQRAMHFLVPRDSGARDGIFYRNGHPKAEKL